MQTPKKTIYSFLKFIDRHAIETEPGQFIYQKKDQDAIHFTRGNSNNIAKWKPEAIKQGILFDRYRTEKGIRFKVDMGKLQEALLNE